LTIGIESAWQSKRTRPPSLGIAAPHAPIALQLREWASTNTASAEINIASPPNPLRLLFPTPLLSFSSLLFFFVDYPHQLSLFSSAMTAFPENQQTGVIPIASHPREDDPPAYTYHPLSSRGPTPPGTPDLTGKTILVPPPTPPRTISPALVSPLSNTRVPLSATPTTIPALSGAELRTLDSRDPLSTCDARFADLILTHVIIPRLRVGVLRWKDRESLEYVPQTKEDVRPSERILCYLHFSVVGAKGVFFRENSESTARNTMTNSAFYQVNINSDSIMSKRYYSMNLIQPVSKLKRCGFGRRRGGFVLNGV